MRVGLVLPVFAATPAAALQVAVQAEDEGLDGVFSYDHLFPIGRPDRPALSALPVLGAVAAHTSRIRLGPLVSRVSLLPEEVLVSSLVTVDRISGGRLIAGIGAGDRMTAPEHAAYGLPFPPVGERLERLADVAVALRGAGVHTWIGGTSERVRALALAAADGWNCWSAADADLTSFPRPAERTVELSWGGPPPADRPLVDHLRHLARLGADWAVYGPPPSTDWPRFVREMAEAAQSVK